MATHFLAVDIQDGPFLTSSGDITTVTHRLEWVLFDEQQGCVLETTCLGMSDGTDVAYFFQKQMDQLSRQSFVVSFEMMKLDALLQAILPPEAKRHWDHYVLKCDLGRLDLQRLLDEELYAAMDLPLLHATVCSAAGPLSSAAVMTGRVFHKFVCTYERNLLYLYIEDPGPHPRVRPNKSLLIHTHWWDCKPTPTGPWDDQPIQDRSELLARTLKYVVVDVETHDWIQNGSIESGTAIGRIVEIAWLAADEQHNVLERQRLLVRPYADYERVSFKARRTHGIPTKLAREKGVDIRQVMASFVNLLNLVPQSGFVIAHNMQHEDAIISLSLDADGLNVWGRLPKCCTWSPRFLSRFYPLYSSRKYVMELKDLFQEEVGEPESPENLRLQQNAHSADADVEMTWTVFKHLQGRVDQTTWHDEMNWNRYRLQKRK